MKTVRPNMLLDPDVESTRRAAYDLLPRSCAVVCKMISALDQELPEEESRAISGATNSRKLEFAAGRIAAHEALRSLGISNAIIPVGQNRSPTWPPGFIGSIAHASGIAIAAVARVRDIIALGIDIECAAAASPEIWPEIMLQAELDFLKSLPESGAVWYATIIFSIKEAFYKFQYPHTRQWLGFHDLTVLLNLKEKSCFILLAFPVNIEGRELQTFTGYFQVNKDLIITVIFMLRDQNQKIEC